jgi:PAS domain-containing protein
LTGKGVGVLYLENNLTVGAFTSDRIAVLNHLSTQAAISLENSRILYESQQSKLELQQSNAFLEAQREASPDGILVIDKNRRISAYNHGFVEICRIPQQILDTNDDYQLLGFVLEHLAQPEEFLKKVEYLYEHPQEASFDEINLKDGRI